MKLTKKDKELIEVATDVVKSNSDLYENLGMHVAAAVRAKSGKIYKGININTSHSICAEQVAMGQAFANGERDLEAMVAVKMNDDGSVRVVSPCGLCRYIFNNCILLFSSYRMPFARDCSHSRRDDNSYHCCRLISVRISIYILSFKHKRNRRSNCYSVNT